MPFSVLPCNDSTQGPIFCPKTALKSRRGEDQQGGSRLDGAPLIQALMGDNHTSRPERILDAGQGAQLDCWSLSVIAFLRQLSMSLRTRLDNWRPFFGSRTPEWNRPYLPCQQERWQKQLSQLRRFPHPAGLQQSL